jgi:hypothetical protein
MLYRTLKNWISLCHTQPSIFMPYFAYASEGIDQDCVHKTEKISKVTNRIVQAMDVLDIQSIHVD